MNETRLPSNRRPTTRECVHLVTRGHFRSHDKDGGHTIQSVRFTIKVGLTTFIYELACIQSRYTEFAKINFLHQDFPKLSSDILTYIQTQSKLYTSIYHAALQVIKNQFCSLICSACF